MDLGIRGKVALVAAASKGFGRAIARGLAAEGAHVAICARGADDLHQAADEIRSMGDVEVLPVIADVSRAKECARFVEAAAQRWGRIDILVTNSGGPPPGNFADFDDAAWHEAIESTLLNVARLIRLTLPHMRPQGWGRIVNVQSVSVKQPIDGLLLSNSIRPGAIGLAKTLSFELARDGILINNVCPGSHDTDRIREVIQSRAEQNGTSIEVERDLLAGSIPLGRLGRPEELADTVVFLCSERASFVTGTTVVVDGGACRSLT